VAKVRVHELAKELGVESKVVLAKLKEMGEFVKSASSTVEPPVVKRFADQYGDQLKAAGQGTKRPAAPKPAAQAPAPAAVSAPAETAAPAPAPSPTAPAPAATAPAAVPDESGPRPGPRPGPAKQAEAPRPVETTRPPVPGTGFEPQAPAASCSGRVGCSRRVGCPG
jgi:translation initiation factor IF-2